VSRWREREFFRAVRPRRKRAPGTCPWCRCSVIWARIRSPRPRGGGRTFVPFVVEKCAEGDGNIALSIGLFHEGEAPLAQVVAIGTTYRSHRDNCPGLPPKTKLAATSPAAHSAKSFNRKRNTGGSQ
jgi:hypothetical protein